MLGIVGLCLHPVRASAHAVGHERRIVFKASEGVLEAQFIIELDPVVSRSVRRLFDRNRDGVLQQAEAQALRSYLEKRAVGAFELRRKGEKLVPVRGQANHAGIEAASGSLSARATLRWEGLVPGERLAVRDTGDSAGHVPVVLERGAERIRFGAVKIDPRSYDLPGDTTVSLIVE